MFLQTNGKLVVCDKKMSLKAMNLQKERECNIYNGYSWLGVYMIEYPIMAWAFKSLLILTDVNRCYINWNNGIIVIIIAICIEEKEGRNQSVSLYFHL
jgi:hypothetical protein